MKRILTTLSQKWPEYLLEILVLIIGIYGAFALEDWNDRRKVSQQEKGILLQIQNEYLENLSQLNQKIQIRNILLKNSVKILEIIDDPENSAPDSLIASLAFSMMAPTFDPISSDVITSGNIRLITNQRLKELLQKWSSDVIQLQEEEKKWTIMVVEQLLPLMNKMGITRYIPNRTYSQDGEKVRNLILIDSAQLAIQIIIPKSQKAFNAEAILQNNEFDGLITAGIMFNRVANTQSFLLQAKILEILELVEADLNTMK
jgi:hypothetical protein